MKKFYTLIAFFLILFNQSSYACHQSSINSVVGVDNGDGTTTYTIGLTVDVGGTDGYSHGFALVFGSSVGTPYVVPGSFTPTLTRPSYDPLTGFTGAGIGTGMGGSTDNYFDLIYANRTDVLTYEADDDWFFFGSTDYTKTVVVTVQGCVETITLNADFRSLDGNEAVVENQCVKVFNLSKITNITAGTQTACNIADNTYTQQITVTYSNPPSSGTLVINGVSYAITGSPQTITLTGLDSDGLGVDINAYFSVRPYCEYDYISLFTAPVACEVACSISGLAAGTQTACNSGDNTYTQEVIVTYSGAPGSGTLDVNGQSFAITGSPQTVTLTGLNSNGAAVNVTAAFSADAGCTMTTNSLFTAPAACNACSISGLAAGTQTACNPGDNTYTQQVVVTYTNAPGSGTLDVNGQSFAITGSPQTVTLTGLSSNGAAVNVTAAFSADAGCTMTTNSLFTAPAACTPVCSITGLAAGTQTACNPGDNTYTQQVVVTYSNAPGSGTLNVNGQTFAITGSPQTVTLTGLNSNGAAVNVTAAFSADAGCTMTTNSLFTAPAACNGGGCTANNGTWDN